MSDEIARFAGLKDPNVASVLGEVHRASKGDKWVFLRALPSGLGALLTGKPFMDGITPHLANAFIGVPDEVGRLLYLTARSIDAQQAIEFGTSFGISALYLASAMRANGGHFIGTEIEPRKVSVARDYLAHAGLSDWSDIREGNAMETLCSLKAPIDIVLLDGWKDLYLPVLKLLTPKLRPGAVVFADNIYTFKKALAPYVAHVRAEGSGFESTTLPLGSGIEMSVYRPDLQADEKLA